jgi:hypothetical protein
MSFLRLELGFDSFVDTILVTIPLLETFHFFPKLEVLCLHGLSDNFFEFPGLPMTFFCDC